MEQNTALGATAENSRVLSHLEDKDMEELANRVIGTLQNMTDEEFSDIDLEAAELI